MENIKNLTPEELVELVHTWYKANKEKRSIIIMAGQEEDKGLASTHCISGKGLLVRMMMMEFVADNSKLIKDATMCSLIRDVLTKGDKEDEKSE